MTTRGERRLWTWRVGFVASLTACGVLLGAESHAQKAACLEQHYNHRYGYSETRRKYDSLGRQAWRGRYDDSMTQISFCYFYPETPSWQAVQYCAGLRRGTTPGVRNWAQQEDNGEWLTWATRFDEEYRRSYSSSERTVFTEDDDVIRVEFAYFGPYSSLTDHTRYCYYEDVEPGRLRRFDTVYAGSTDTGQVFIFYYPGGLEKRLVISSGVLGARVITTRDSEGRVLSVAWPGSQYSPEVRLYSYDDQGLLTSEEWTDLSGGERRLATTYTYDEWGRLLKEREYRRDGSVRRSTAYYYDCRGFQREESGGDDVRGESE